MDYDRPSVSRSGERPVTRWRREQEPNDRSHTFTESSNTETPKTYNKMERPHSRRGVKTDITEYGISRPPTSGKAVFSRPPSPNINLSNRVATATSRIGTPNSATLTRMNSGLSRSFTQPNAIILDRPITQQGLVGVRPGSSRATPKLSRQIQDKMHYKQLLQMKIQELNQEITSITDQVNGTDIEKDRLQYYSGMTNDSPEPQEHLGTYNTDFDKNKSDISNEEIEQEAKTLKEINDSIESVLQKQKEAKKKLNEVNKEVEFKQKIVEKFADSMDSETKLKYDEAYRKQSELQKEIDNLQEEYDQLVTKQYSQKEKIALSPFKQEIYSVYNRISGIGQKNGQDNSDMNAAKKQIIEIEKKIAVAQQELEQLETDAVDDQGDLTYNNKKDEETLELMSEESKIEELIMQLNSLEENIVNRLERISNDINESIDESQLNTEDIEMFQMLMEQNFENRNNKNFEELKDDYAKLCQTLNKLEILETKIKKPKGVQDQVDASEDVQIFRNDFENESSKNHQYEPERKDVRKNDNMENNYNEIIKKIEENELNRFISIFEDKLQKISFTDNNQSIKSTTDTGKTDNSSLTNVILSLTNQYNTILINSIKSVY